MGQPAAKLSVSIPGELAAAVRKRVGARGLSGFVARAVAHELEQAGHMLAKLKLSSAHAVDAFVVATALQFDKAVIATGDPDDIRRLAAPFARVGIFAL
jgi:hypothetical protein